MKKIPIGKGECIKDGVKVAVLTIGTVAHEVKQAIDLLDDPDLVAHYDLRFVKPLDEDLLHEAFKKHEHFVTVEDGVLKGGFGSAVLEFANLHGYHQTIECLGIPDYFPEHGTVEELKILVGLSPNDIKRTLEDLL